MINKKKKKLSNLNLLIEHLEQKYLAPEIIISGDFNSELNKQENSIRQYFEENNFFTHYREDQKTHGSKIIDYIVSKNTQIKNYEVKEKIGKSDHQQI